MADQNSEIADELTRDRQAGWDGFMTFSKISIVLIALVLVFLALVTL